MKGIARSERAEPVRLLAGGGNDHERRLLEAADLDVMPSGTPARLAQSLLGPSATPRNVTDPVRDVRPPWTELGKPTLLTGLGGLAGVGAIAWLLGTPASPRRDALLEPTVAQAAPQMIDTAVAPSSPAPLVHSALPYAPDPLAPLPDQPTANVSRGEAPAPDGSDSAARARRAHRGSGSIRRAPDPVQTGSLLEEAGLLESARVDLRKHDSVSARGALDRYRSRFQSGELELEADLLEAELLLLEGKAARAAALARELMTRPAARYRERIRQIIRRAEDAAPGDGSMRAGQHMDERRKKR